MTRVFDTPLGVDILKALGLNPNDVISLDLHSRVGRIETLDVEFRVASPPEGVDSIVTACRRFKLVPIEEQDDDEISGSHQTVPAEAARSQV